MADGHLDFARVRPPGAPKVRVGARPTQPRHAVIDIVTDDMPFLVDSVTQELARQDVAINLLIHPQFVVRRDLDGRLLDILGTLDAHEAPADAFVESWMHIEVAGPADAERRGDRCAATSCGCCATSATRSRTGPHARYRVARRCDSRQSRRSRCPPARQAEVVEFLRWLADDHFTFLGCRDYRLVDDEGVESLAAVAGSGSVCCAATSRGRAG